MVLEGVLPCKIKLLPGHRVRCGTPLTYESNAWRPTKPGESASMFATSPDMGDPITAYKAMIVETYVHDLQVGPVRIRDVQDNGAVEFENHPEGPYLALTASRVFLG